MAVKKFDEPREAKIADLDNMYNGIWMLVTQTDDDFVEGVGLVHALGDGNDDDEELLFELIQSEGLQDATLIRGCGNRGEEILHSY